MSSSLDLGGRKEWNGIGFQVIDGAISTYSQGIDYLYGGEGLSITRRRNVNPGGRISKLTNVGHPK